jgi:ubiquinone/menaquinone biosynthesis C-methylase UbiE
MLLFILLIIGLISGIINGKRYDKIKNITTKFILELSKFQGNEKVLDLGTGAGLVAINFAKNMKDGEVYGLDRWNWSPIIKSRLLFHMITGSNINNAKQNAKFENVSSKCNFITGSITEKLEFSDNYFEIICSNDSLYFVRDREERNNLFMEINRVLKKGGRFLFCEPEKSCSGWNIQYAMIFFKDLKYEINIFPVKLPRGWVPLCILVGRKI